MKENDAEQKSTLLSIANANPKINPQHIFDALIYERSRALERLSNRMHPGDVEDILDRIRSVSLLINEIAYQQGIKEFPTE